MKKVFISVGMTGRSNDEVERDLEKAKKEIKEYFTDDVETVDNWSAIAPENANPRWYLAEAINKLGDCDYVYFMYGWENYKGCKVEHYVAELYGMHIIHGTV